MKIFADFHHSGLARSLVLALQCRLGHEVHFPGTDFVEKTLQLSGGHHILLSCLPSWTLSLGGFPEPLNKEWTQLPTYAEFMDTDWDVFLVTRPETQLMFRELKKLHRNGANIKIICQTGNDGTSFDWNFCKNFLASDYASYHLAPKEVNKIWYMQELGGQYLNSEFVPIGNLKVLHTINSFINCWPTFTSPWSWTGDMGTWGGRCPHCSGRDAPVPPSISPYGIWEGAKNAMPDYTFNEYGIACTLGCIPEVCLPLEYVRGALTVHMKTYDGYGYSALQSIACGRLVVVPRGFHRYRTAGRVLIPNLTCLESEWTSDSLIGVIKDFTQNIDEANKYSLACWKASKAIFDFDLEAMRLKKFMEELI
jgi:hypothetical protein